MKSKTLLITLTLLLGVAALLAAQAPKVVIEYFENNSGGMYVRAADGSEIEAAQLSFGEELGVGGTLITMKSDYAELRLVPNGTIIRVSENTNFSVASIQGRDGAAQNGFSVAVGKIKSVVAKGTGNKYSFKGASAVMGVRGTQFIFSVLPGVKELAYAIDGVIDYTNAAGQTISVGAGFMADALAASFEAFAPPPDVLDDLLAGMDFKALKLDDVPGYLKEVSEAIKEEGKPEAEKAKTPKWLQRLMDFLGMEIGTVTIEGQTWAKAIIQPRFAIGKFKAALYLPVIYKSDMFDPSDWYHPKGNDEWSFGTDQAGWQKIALDAVNDLFLKIRYIEYGEQRDPFFIKFGNLADITMGHGTIMRGYANDTDFPSVRKIGLNLGLDSAKVGLETMVNDAANPQIFGARVYFRPFAPSFPMAFGLTALADINPEQVLFGDTPEYGKPTFLNGGVDLDLPIVHSDALSIILFSDLAAMIPYFREAPTAVAVPSLQTPGFAMEAVLSDGTLKNWGLAAGLLGNILVIDYRLEFRYSDGTFKPAFYNALYDRISKDYVIDLVSYLANPVDPQYGVRTMGVYGELGYALQKVFYIKGGYFWPWPADPAAPDSVWPDDTLHLEFGILEGLLPLYGAISMDRVGLAGPLKRGETLSFFDKNLLFSGEIVYPFSPIMEFALQITTNVFVDKVYPSVSILTRLNG